MVAVPCRFDTAQTDCDCNNTEIVAIKQTYTEQFSRSLEKYLGSETSGSAAALYATRAKAYRPLQAHPHCQRPGQPRMCGALRTPCFTFSEADKSLTVDLTKAKQKANVMYKVL